MVYEDAAAAAFILGDHDLSHFFLAGFNEQGDLVRKVQYAAVDRRRWSRLKILIDSVPNAEFAHAKASVIIYAKVLTTQRPCCAWTSVSGIWHPPKDPDTWRLHAEVLALQGDWAGAAASFRRAVEGRSRWWRWSEILAIRCSRKTDQPEQATAALGRYLKER